MSVGRCMREHTHRQYLAFLYHLYEERNNPDVTEYYLMQIAREIRGKGKVDDFRLEFPGRKATTDKPKTAQEATDYSKNSWMAALGPNVKVVRRPASERPTSD